MPTINELHSVLAKEVELVIAQSALLLQREGGLNGELKTSGSIVESFIKKIFVDYIVPNYMKVTSGYIATPEKLTAQTNLPQCDILICNGSFPSIMTILEGQICVTPKELFTGLIEVKRSLDKKQLRNALVHINEIIAEIDHDNNLKTDNELNAFNNHIGYQNYSSNKPLVGIIALQNKLDNFASDAINLIKETNSCIDFVWTLDGFSLIPGFVNSEQQVLYYPHTARPRTVEWSSLEQSDFRHKNPFYSLFENAAPTWVPLTTSNDFSSVQVFTKLIGYLSLVMSKITTGKIDENLINQYYLVNR